MTPYVQLDLVIEPLEPWRDVLVADLGELGYDSFEETENGVLAYIPETRFDQAAVIALIAGHAQHVRVRHDHRTIPGRNWNSEWEKSFEPVEVGKEVRIRAEFHTPGEGFREEIVITPRMAFGTGHHATTRMMVEAMLRLDLREQDVCDYGCGTAVLAILAERRGARSVHGIEIDGHAVLNARENVMLNGCHRIIVEKGDAHLLRPLGYGAILANIERNTLLRDMSLMRDALRPGGALLLSGFTTADAARMTEAVMAAGMVPAEALNQGEWALIGCRK